MIRKIITDSASDLNKEILDCEFIELAPFNLEIDGEHYIDTPDIDKMAYLDKMEKSPNTPMTAAPSPQYYYEIFKEANEAFAVTITSKLSGSYNSAMSAKNMIEEEFKDKKIHIFDTKTACAGQTLIVYKLKELIDNGFDFETIIEKLNHFIDNTKTYYYMQSFDNLVKTGRTNAYMASIAKLLNISIIGTTEDGLIKLEQKIRGQKKAIAKLVDIVVTSEIDFTDRVLSISYVDGIESALELKNAILEKVKFKDVIIQETSCLCTNYAARFGLIVAF